MVLDQSSAWVCWVHVLAQTVPGPAVAVEDLAPAKDPGSSDHRDVWAADPVFHPGATVRSQVLDSL